MKPRLRKTRVFLTATLALLMSKHAALAQCVSSLITIQVLSSPLRFGTIDDCTFTSGTVAVDAGTGARTTGGCINALSGISNAARVRVAANQSKNNDKVVIRIPATTYTMNNGFHTLDVTGWDLSLKGGGPSVVINGRQTKTLGVGSTVIIAGVGSANGTYNGTFTIEAVCQ